MTVLLKDLNVDSLSDILGIPQSVLVDLTDIAPRLYFEKLHPKKNGGFRTLGIPYSVLKKVQKSLLTKIFNNVPTHPKLFGRPGTSIKDAVASHTKKAVVITMDIKNFFPSTKSYKIKNALMRNGVSIEISELLTRLVSHKNHLPQGAPTSPCIGRIVLHPVAEQIEGYLSNISRSDFSIYVDDITLSGPKGIEKVKEHIYKILNRHKYEINKSKTYVMKREADQVSLNIKLNNGIEATEKMLEEIEKLEFVLPMNHPTLLGKKSFVKFLMKNQ